MAVTATLYNSFKGKGYDSSTKIDLANDTIKVMLVGSGYTPDIDAHDFINDVSANESSGTGYTAGGATLAGKTWTQVDASDLWKFDANDTSWTISSSLTARYAVIYKDTGNTATSPLIGYVNLDGTFTLAAGTFTLTWNASGIFTLA
jgi:hypothetical protein